MNEAARSRPAILRPSVLVSFVALAALAWITWQGLRPPLAHASFVDAGRTALWRVEVDAGGDRLTIEALAKIEVPAGRARELWTLQPGAAPAALGRMPESGELRLPLDDAQAAALATAKYIAVSDEPADAATGAAPAGDLLYIAALVRPDDG
jgi:anti-sigma-K factor RskA